MDLTVTIAVLGAALAHATWNAVVKTGSDHLISITGVSLGAALTSLVIFPFAGSPDAASWPFLVASVALHSIYMISLSQAYRYSDFSSAYPIARGTAPVLVFAWSLVFLNEALNTREMLGILGIIGGITVFSTRRLDKVMGDRKALFYALLTAVMIAAYTLVDGMGVRRSASVSGYMVWMTVFESLPLLLYTWVRRGKTMLPALAANASSMLIAGVLAVGGYWVVIWAMTQEPIAMVAALRESSIIMAALIGAFYFKEPSGKRRIIAAVIVSASVVILRL